MNTLTRTVLDTLRIIDTREVGHDSYEICATAQAIYDDDAREMQINLHSFVRLFEIRGKDQILQPSWLPHADCVKMHVALDEAPEAAKEIFRSWAEKIRKLIPGPGEWTSDAPWLRAGGVPSSV